MIFKYLISFAKLLKDQCDQMFSAKSGNKSPDLVTLIFPVLRLKNTRSLIKHYVLITWSKTAKDLCKESPSKITETF